MKMKLKNYNDDKLYDIFEENSFQLQFDKEEGTQNSIIEEVNESESLKSNDSLNKQEKSCKSNENDAAS